MDKLLLSIFIVLTFSSCKERNGPEPETSKFTGKLFSSTTNEPTHTATREKVFKEEILPIESTPIKEVTPQKRTPVQTTSTESIVEDIPILEDDLPVIPEPILIEETRPLPGSSSVKQTFRGGVRSNGLDIKAIRSSQSAKRERLVFDSYISNDKATQSGKYTFTYNPSKNQITAVVYGYRKFSALTTKKNRTFPNNSLIDSIKMEKMLDDSAFKFNISLKDAASVNVFELKSPARIVVDITKN